MDKTIDPSECIVLVSDDDDEDSSPETKKRKSPSECLNVECTSGVSYVDSVPSFVLTYYRVRRQLGLKVCQDCFEEACDYFEGLKTRYEKRESIYEAPCSKYKPVLNIDSDDEEDLSPDDEEVPFEEETVRMIEEELPLAIKGIMTDSRTRAQLDDSYVNLKRDSEKLQKEYSGIKETFDNIQSQIDELRQQVYAKFPRDIKMLPPLEIEPEPRRKEPMKYKNVLLKRALSNPCTFPPTSPANLNDSSLDVVAVSEEILVPPKTLPPPGSPATKPKLRMGDEVFVMKFSYKYPWKTGVVERMIRDKGYNEYHVKLSNNPGKKNVLVTGKHLAYKSCSSYRFVVGYRVISVFKEDRTSNSSMNFYSGIVAEPPKAMNRFRYLIFFDDGCAQYVPHENIRLICEPSINPWEDTPSDTRDFIRKYLLEYPERPMVKLQVGNMVRVEYQSNWLQAKVMEVDGSLVNMLFMLDGRTEWIYRGSLRLEPLFREFDAAKRRKETGDRIRRIAGRLSNNSPYVEYTHQADTEGDEDSNESAKARSVARKSSSHRVHKGEKPPKWIPASVPGSIEFKKLSNILQPRKFVAHQCGPLCIQWTQYNKDSMKETTPLEIPLHFGYRRIISHFGGNKRSVLYRAPCGRSLRNMGEVHMYLRITKSEMTVDLFDFDYWVNCLSEFIIRRCNLNIPDITYGKENCPINCVNYIDNVLPVFSSYLTEREPRDDVDLNLDPEFLCGCDCTDDCQDKEKCACWQLTIESQKLIPNNDLDPNVGYHYRRLPERVITGIYECNSQCKCSKLTCLNRVVQYPLSQKLQLFKTEKKGWGIRCLNDIPQGAFICVYAGHLLTEQEANEEGKTYGDEYLAELDYIEVIESTKEGYESDVDDPDDDGNDGNDRNDEKHGGKYEEDSPVSSPEGVPIEIGTEETQSSYKSRLRERKVKQTTPPPKQAAKEQPKKKKEELFSIRKYYGDNEGEVFIMDAKCSGNIGRYLNHSCMPNVFVQNVFVDTHDLRFPWVAFFAQTYIIAGTELTWDYNYDIGSVEGKRKDCYCGSSNCRGRLL